MLRKAWRYKGQNDIWLYKGGTDGFANAGNEPFNEFYACLDFCKKLGEDVYQDLCSMIVFDAVIYNEDRHFGNFGVLRDNHTGEIKGLAPVFDNGLSLFNYAMKDDFDNIEAYAASGDLRRLKK